MQQVPQWRPVLNRFFWLESQTHSDLPAARFARRIAGSIGTSLLRSPGGTAEFHSQTRHPRLWPDARLLIRGSSVVNVLNDLAELEHFRT